MAEDSVKKRTFWERLQHTYRLVIMNNETFEEIGSYRLSLLNVYIFLSTLMVLVAIIVLSLILFTPLKRFVPGYGDIQASPQLIMLNQELDSVYQEFSSQKVYIENLRKRLSDQADGIEDIPDENHGLSDSSLQVDRIEEDEILRREVELEQIEEIAGMKTRGNASSADVPLEQLYFIPPITGEISARFMPEKKHYGIDILAPKNTAIKSVMDGIVIASDWTLETGNTIGIQHSNNIISFYKHNSLLLKKVGDYVQAGEAVAIIGNTGTLSDGPHLHFEVWVKGMPIDPVDYINFN
jgi:murein DD-endopeptidase MepM/ murein hydrolase activator NlpD